MIKRLLLLTVLTAGLLSLPAQTDAAVAAQPAPAQLPTQAPATRVMTASLPEAMASSTNGLLTVNVDHGVPLKLSGPATSVFIANPDIADVQVMSPTSIMIFGKRTGETTFMATDEAGNTLAQRTVEVMQDLYPLRMELNAAIPGNHIRTESLPNGLILTGEAKDPASVADAYKIAQRYIGQGGDIINRIHVVGSNQIMIRVRFAEVARSVDNSLGFNWGDLTSVSGFTFGVATGAISAITAGTGIVSQRPANTNLSLPNDVIGVSGVGKNWNVNGVIDALAQDGLVTILAEPNLTAMSGETANFLAGGEFPIPIPQGLGNISIQFKDYGISLEFTPTLISDDRISLHVKPEVSELSSTGAIVLDNITVPALTTRKAETTVEVASGQSFAIAGLLDNSQAQTVNKFPILGDMPVLGPLFRSSEFQNGQTELVVIITPYIVKPTRQELSLPTDNLAPPNETERLLGLRYDSADPNARSMSGPPLGKNVQPPSASAIIPVPVLPQSALTPPPSMASQPLPPPMPSTMVEPSFEETPPTPVATAAPQPVPGRGPFDANVATVSAPVNGPVDAPMDALSDTAPRAAADAEPLPPAMISPPLAKSATASNHPASASPQHSDPTSLTPAGPGGFVLE